MFGQIDETKNEATPKLEISEISKNVELENVKSMHKNDLKFPAPLPKLADDTSNANLP